MASKDLEAQAGALGIPMQIRIDDNLRYNFCDARVADLASIEGETAVYKGECSCRHHYEIRYEIEELRKMVQIVNGQLVVGQNKSFKAGQLEEY